MTTLDTLVTRAKTVGGALRVYKVGEVPASPGHAFMVLGLDSGTRRGTRSDGRSVDRTYRLTAQLFGTSEAAVADMVTRADAAFFDKTLTELDGDPYSVREMQVGPIRDPDAETLLYVLHTYRF